MSAVKIIFLMFLVTPSGEYIPKAAELDYITCARVANYYQSQIDQGTLKEYEAAVCLRYKNIPFGEMDND